MIHQHILVLMFSSSCRITPALAGTYLRIISAAQKQGRPHCGTDTQPLPRLFQLESKKKKEEEDETKTNRAQNSGEVYYEAGYDCAQLTFDRSSIVHTPIVQSLFPVFGCHGTKTSDGQELAKLF